jgi:uncharacterized protein (DUF58 family)
MASNEAASGLTNFKSRRLFRSKNKVRTYILPTGFGYAFGAVAIVLFFLAVGYANNLIYIFLFFLISMALTGMVATNRNTDGIEITNIQPEGFFAEESGNVLVTLKNTRAVELWSFEIFFQKNPDQVVHSSVKEKSEEVVEVPFASETRGEVQLPRLILQSTFPFGLFRAWQAHRKNPRVLVYPARKGSQDFPAGATNADHQQNVGLFRDHRHFQSSDPVRRIDWRASARRQDLLVKNFEEGDKPSLHFRWDQTRHLNDFETRLSQLSLWIDTAEINGNEYSLELGDFKSTFSRGPQHRRQCLEVLARAQKGDVS